MIETFLNHLGERCMEAEVVEIVIVYLTRALIALLELFTKGVIALGEGVQVDIYREMTVDYWIFRVYNYA